MQRIGMALGSGGARGWCHLGVLSELEVMGLRPDMVAGCSMGSVVGAAWAAGRIEAMTDWALSLTRQGFLRQVDLSLTGGGLVNGRAITDVLGEIGVPERFEDLEHPLIVVATDMATGREVWLQEGSVLDAVRASVAIPGVISPHCVKGRWLLDGGLVNPVPVSAARALGADRTIAVDPNAKLGKPLWQPETKEGGFWDSVAPPAFLKTLPESIASLLPSGDKSADGKPHYVDVVSVSIDIVTEFLRQTRAAVDPPELTLQADLNHILSLEIFRAGEAVEEGRRLVRAAANRLETVWNGTA
jgi:NTE family protein